MVQEAMLRQLPQLSQPKQHAIYPMSSYPSVTNSYAPPVAAMAPLLLAPVHSIAAKEVKPEQTSVSPLSHG